MTDWFGWLADDVDTADSRTTWIFEPSLFWRTFSVTLTLRRRRVENPEEHSVSVGEDGQEWAALASPSIEVVPEQMRDKLSTSWWKNGQRSSFDTFETRFEVQGPSEMYYEGYLMIVPDQYFDSFLFRFVASLFVCCIRGSK